MFQRLETSTLKILTIFIEELSQFLPVVILDYPLFKSFQIYIPQQRHPTKSSIKTFFFQNLLITKILISKTLIDEL